MNMNVILNHILMFLLALYGDPNYPRKLVQEVIDFFDNFIRTIFIPFLREDILRELSKLDISKDVQHNIMKCFDIHSNVFDRVKTEHSRFALFRKKGFIDYELFRIGTAFIPKLVNDNIRMLAEIVYALHVPLRKSLKVFLEIPGLFDQILQHIRKLREEKNIITNCMQVKLWSRIRLKEKEGEITLPFFIFDDDLEVGNCLGSHAGKNKYSAVYAQIACLPPHLASRLASIIFSTLVFVEDKTKHTNQQVFRKLIEEINFLQTEGIQINVDGIQERVKFQLVLIIGDNFGLNGMLGFTQSFNATSCCRICKAHSDITASLTKEQECLLRNRENYEKDVKDQNAAESGIKEPCAFNEISNYYVTENLSVDMMHDILEGICLYVMSAIIFVFIFKKKYFILELLNSRLRAFPFNDNSNRPPEISGNTTKNKNKMQLKMSASEMLSFVRFFELIIGDLIDEEDEHWQLYKYLRQIIDRVTSPRVISADAKQLKRLVKLHNELYIRLIGPLKPKFHNLIHYARILEENGPFINFWCMRFKSRHREVKSNAQSTSCTSNLLITIAIKPMLRMCSMIHNLDCKSTIVLGSSEKDTPTESYNDVQICGTSFKIGTFVVTDLNKIEKEFGKIWKITEVNNDIFFSMQIFEEMTFDEHTHAYICQPNNDEPKLFKQLDLPQIAPCLYVQKGNTHFIATDYGL